MVSSRNGHRPALHDSTDPPHDIVGVPLGSKHRPRDGKAQQSAAIYGWTCALYSLIECDTWQQSLCDHFGEANSRTGSREGLSNAHQSGPGTASVTVVARAA